MFVISFHVASALLLATVSVAAREIPVATPSEFAAAMPALAPGDTVVLKAGVWRDATLQFRAQGESARPITLRAEIPGATILEGASQLTIDGAHLVVAGLKFSRNAGLPAIITPYKVTVASVVTFTKASRDCRLTETAIVDSGDGVSNYVHLEPGSRANRIDHCFFSNQGAIGVTFYVEVHPTQPNRHQVDHNYFGDRKPGTGNRWETIRIGHAEQQDFVSETTVAQNYFFRCNGENECVSDKSTGNRYLSNAFVETRGQLTLRHGARARVEGNFFFAGEDPASDGLRVIGPDHVVLNNYFKGVRNGIIVYSGETDPKPTGYRPVARALIAGNTIEHCANALVLGSSGRAVPPKNVTLAGNLVIGRSAPLIHADAKGMDIAYVANLMLGPELGIADTPGIDRDAPPLITDEWGRVFPDPARSKLRLNRTVHPALASDLNGEVRAPQTNIGAIGERNAAPKYPRTRDDVGPAWLRAKTPP